MADDAPIYRAASSPKKKDPYVTKLSEKDETAYQDWLKEKGVTESDDYDMRGYYRSVGGLAPEKGAHFPDTFKKPNHPTFSDESQYHGFAGNEGGKWKKVDSKWTFKPGKTNIDNGLEQTRGYLERNDPDVTLIAPDAE